MRNANENDGPPRLQTGSRRWLRVLAIAASAQVGLLLGILGIQVAEATAGERSSPEASGAQHLHVQDPRGPWSIHTIKIPRRSATLKLDTLHAKGTALGLSPLTAQLKILSNKGLAPLGAINGDYYAREGAYAGDPRGLQIVDREMISAPKGTASFWLDAVGDPHAGVTTSGLELRWPSGVTTAIGLNEARPQQAIVLYTPSLGKSTLTKGGRELILEAVDRTWLPLRPGKMYRARIQEIQSGGNAKIEPGKMVISIGPSATIPALEAGDELQISTGTEPVIRAAQMAISGGPILVRNGKAQKIKASEFDSYEASSMIERHPRSAVGWDDEYFYLVTVDGRHKGVSVGMDLNEFAQHLLKMGCSDAMNLDGGGSATLWFDGAIRNRPCDGYEREIANGIVLVRKPARKAK